MKAGKYISDIVPLTQSAWQRDRMNFFQADTGQGKTVAAIHTIPEALGIPSSRCLILIDTNAGKENKINTEGCRSWNDPTDRRKPTIMTYAEFAVLLKEQRLYSSDFDYIACDEVHNLAKYARVDRATIVARNPDYDSATINIILTRESLNYRAFETLKRWCAAGRIWMFGFSATPRMLEEWTESEGFLNKIQHSEQMIVYEVLQKYTYNDIHSILADNPSHKRLIHAPSIAQVEQFTQEISDTTGRRVIGLWSRNSERPMSSEQIRTLEWITQDERFPPDVYDVVATEAYSTGYNLKDDTVQEIIVHTGNPDVQIQFKGRKRADVPILRLYDAKKARERQKNAKRRDKLLSQQITIPPNYLNTKLKKPQRDELLSELQFPKGWNLFTKAIEKEKKYTIKKSKNYVEIVLNSGEES